MPNTRTSVFRAARWAVVLVVFVFASYAVVSLWRDVRSRALEVHPRWTLVLASGTIVLATYGVLIEAWRVVLAGWGARLPFWRAAHIWFVASFGKYVPGKIWSITAMGVMAQSSGVSATIAAGSSIVVTVLNIVAGFGVILATGSRVLSSVDPRLARVALVGVTLSVIGLALAPLLVPRLVAFAARLSGRTWSVPRLPSSAIWLALLANVVAWVLYGIAFRLFCAGILGVATGATPAYIAVYTASYLVGYLVIFAPGGVGFREGAMWTMMPALGLATPAQAALLAATSRLWLTILEIVPGLLFVAYDRLRHRLPYTTNDVSS